MKLLNGELLKKRMERADMMSMTWDEIMNLVDSCTVSSEKIDQFRRDRQKAKAWDKLYIHIELGLVKSPPRILKHMDELLAKEKSNV